MGTGANRNDSVLLAATLDRARRRGRLQDVETLCLECLDRGYDADATRRAPRGPDDQRLGDRQEAHARDWRTSVARPDNPSVGCRERRVLEKLTGGARRAGSDERLGAGRVDRGRSRTTLPEEWGGVP